jgi:hypothetical protein
MRRRRHTLQVSTFPFLAVLLCAMGSLILLLLVLDRRAKVVARAKAREQQMAVLAQHSKAEEDRQKDYDRQRDALRRRLQEQEAALHASLNGLQSQLAKEKLLTSQERNRTRELQARLASLRAVLAREQEGYEQTRKQVTAVSSSRNRALTEQQGLARELTRLEQALADVIAFRKRQAETYSLVPYLGKNGERRRPVYIECQANQVIVHPERIVAKLDSWDGASQLGGLAEKLSGRLKANSDESKQKPYVLFLVRPDGIATYYRMMAALGVGNVDSGYELIDADWALDFGEGDGGAPTQPWVARQPQEIAATGTTTTPRMPRGPNPVRGVPQNGMETLGSGEESKVSQAGPTGSRPGGGAADSALTSPNSVGMGRPARALSNGGLSNTTSGTGGGSDIPFSSPGSISGQTAASTVGSPALFIGRGAPAPTDRADGGAGYGSLTDSGGRLADGSSGPGVRSSDVTGDWSGGVRSANAPGSGATALAGGDKSGIGSAISEGRGTGGSNSGISGLVSPVSGASGPGRSGDTPVSFSEQDRKVAGTGQASRELLLPLPGQPGAGGNSGQRARGTSMPGPGDRQGAGGQRGLASDGALVAGASPGGAISPESSASGNGTAPGAGGYAGQIVASGQSGDPALRNPGNAASGHNGPGSAGVSGEVVNGTAPVTPQKNPILPDVDVSKREAAEAGSVANTDGQRQPTTGATVVPNGVAAGTGSGFSGGQAGGGGDPGGEGGSGDGIPSAPDPLAHLQPRPKRASLPPSFRVEANRDLPLLLECRVNEIVFTANGHSWQVADLERNQQTRAAFAQTIEQWIARRQATVREGQTPYRPLIRFKVDPDGVRTYYAAYPLLEKLGVPMRRENVDTRAPAAPRRRP